MCTCAVKVTLDIQTSQLRYCEYGRFYHPAFRHEKGRMRESEKLPQRTHSHKLEMPGLEIGLSAWWANQRELKTVLFFLFKDIIYLFLERGREEEREGEKHKCVVASHTPPTGDLACNPGMCPDWESNR